MRINLKILFISLIGLLCFPLNKDIICDGLDFKAYKMKSIVNPAGLQFGTYPNEAGSSIVSVFKSLGTIQLSRSEFDKWYRIEIKKGKYNWENAGFWHIGAAHNLGIDVVHSINISFTGNEKSIPQWYPQNILDKETYEAAMEFLEAYVKEIITRFGSIILSIDYEMQWWYPLDTPEKRETWSKWYCSAVDKVKQICKDMGQPDIIKTMIILITDNVHLRGLINNCGYNSGGTGQKWLLDAIKKSDYVGFDDYSWDSKEPLSVNNFYDSIRWFIKFYCADKDVYITENGAASSTEEYRRPHGTEDFQAEYLKNAVTMVAENNKENGAWPGRIKSYMWFQFIDRNSEVNSFEQRLGLVKSDGLMTKKKSFFAFQEMMKKYPATIYQNLSDISDEVKNKSIPTKVYFKSSTDNEFIRLLVKMSNEDSVTLNIEVEEACHFVIKINDEHWFGSFAEGMEKKKKIVINLEHQLIKNKENVIDIWFTNERYPFFQNVKSINILKERG